MTLALPATSTPIFDELLTEVIAADELAAHFASIPVDKAPVVIDAEIVDITPAPDNDDTTASGPDGTEAWLWLLAFGALLGAIIYFRITVGVA